MDSLISLYIYKYIFFSASPATLEMLSIDPESRRAAAAHFRRLVYSIELKRNKETSLACDGKGKGCKAR